MSLQHRLHANKAQRDKIMTALAAQSQQDSEQQQSQQEEEEEGALPQRTGKPQGTCTVTVDVLGPKCAGWVLGTVAVGGWSTGGTYAVFCVSHQLGVKHAAGGSGACMQGTESVCVLPQSNAFPTVLL